MTGTAASTRHIAMPDRAGWLSGQYGQALPLMLAIVSVAGLSWGALYYVGHVADARVRLTHAADAAAYSGALAQARSLNALAYINRSEVAHQVAMAHLVTLASWAQFGQTQSQQRVARNPQASLIRRLFGEPASKAYTRAHASTHAAPALARAFQAHDEVVHQILARASASVVADMGDFRQQTMWQVLHANYPEYRSSLSHDQAASGPLGLTMIDDRLPGRIEARAGNAPGHFRDMVQDAALHDAFLQRRRMTRRNGWTVNAQCPEKRHELRRRGRTWLDEHGRWSARDTLSFHASRTNRWIGCHFREYAMGWGSVLPSSAHSVPSADTPPRTFSHQDFWRWVQANTSWDLFSGHGNAMANAYASFDALRWSSSGLPVYHELRDGVAHRALRFAIRVRHSAASLPAMRWANAKGSVAASRAYYGLPVHESVSVSTAAETYFSPPALMADSGSELASLFRPYWQARLSPMMPGDSSERRSDDGPVQQPGAGSQEQP